MNALRKVWSALVDGPDSFGELVWLVIFAALVCVTMPVCIAVWMP